MQKIGMVQEYVLLKETQKPVFFHPEGIEDQSRLIKMRLRAEQAVNLYLEPLDANPETGEVPEEIFLAHCEPGLEQIEFFYRGSFGLIIVGGNIWLDTYDNTSFEVESLDPTSFARLWEREERDPRILEMEQIARMNQRERDAQRENDRAEYEARIKALEERFANVAASQSPSSAPASGGGGTGSSVPSASDSEPAAGPSSADGGEPKADA